METLLQDVRYALRSLRKRLLFSSIAILTLAVGIGANTAIFSVVNAALLRPLPFPEPERMVKALLVTPPRPGERSGPADNDMLWSYPKYEVLRDEQHIFSKLAGYTRWTGNLAGDGEPERLDGEQVTAQYFDLLGVRPLIGRTFTEEETRDPGQARVALLGEGLWRSRFNADPTVLGRFVQLDGSATTIIGIVPSRFRGLTGAATIFLPMASVGAETLTGRWDHFMTVVARLDPNVTFERAQNDMAVLGQRIDEQVPSPMPEGAWSATAKQLDELRIDPAIRRSVLVLFGAVTGVLLIACVNVANLLLARAADRRREIAVRLAIGAARRRLIRQLITEALVLALIGGAFGVLLGGLGVRALSALADNAGRVLGRQISGFNAVSLAGIELDSAVLLFALAASLVTGLLFGAVPALQASRADLTSDLKLGGSATLGILGVRGLTSRSILVVTEIAVAFMLLVGSGLMLRSLSRLLDTDAGVDPRNLLTVRVSLQQSTPPDQSIAFWQQLLGRVSALPGVQSAAIADCPPLIGGCNGTLVWIRDRPPVPRGTEPPIGVHWVTPDYFQTLRVPVKRGRTFDERDRMGSPKVVVINETAARKLFPGENPIGRRIGVGQGGFADGAEIVGVVGDQRFRTMEAPPEPDAYISYNQSARRFGFIYVRTAGEPIGLAPAIRREVQRMDPNLPIYDVQTMEQRVSAATARTRVTGVMLALFAAVALLLALVGIYGVVAYAVTQRTREIGVRIALGAGRTDVAALVLRYSTGLVALGVAFGLAGAWATTRVMRSLLYGVEPTDPLVFASLTLATIAVALAASGAPAARAMRVDPMVALKSE